MRGSRRAPAVGREAALALLVSVAVAAAMTWPALAHPATTIPADLGDPLLLAWVLGWDGHAVLHQPLHAFDANIFFPLHNTLGFTDSLLGYAPVAWVGSGTTAALVRYNLVFVASFAACSWGAYLLARQLGARVPGAAVAGAIFAYAPWRAAQAGHLQILSCGAVPLALALLARGHAVGPRGPARHPRPGVAFAGWCVAAWQLTLGFGVGLQWAYLVALLVLAGGAWWQAAGRPAPPRRLLVADAGGGLLFALVGGVFALPYLRALHDHPEARRTLADVAAFSPPLRGFAITPSTNWVWGGAQESARAGLSFPPEMTLAVGSVAVVLAVLGLLRGAGSWRPRALLAASALVLLVFALGTRGPDGGRWTYVLLFRHVPGFAGIRTPGRLIVTLMIPVALLAAAGADAVVGAMGRVRIPALAGGVALTGLVLLEGVSTLAHPRPAAPPALALRTGTGPALVMPDDEGSDDTTMWWTTQGFPEVANGSSGFVPTVTDRIRTESVALPTASAFTALQAEGIRRIIVVLDRYDGQSRQLLLTGTLPAGVSRQVADGAVVYQLPG